MTRMPWARPVILGVVNVTPDSFSDGGAWFEPDAAIAHGLSLWEQGARILDIGGESTRPGAERPPVGEELRRVMPVVESLVAQGCTVSIDTMRAEVAAAAVASGATVVNDVSGGLADPEMVPFAAESGLPFIAMHWRGHSADMQSRAVYDDVVAEVREELEQRRDAFVAAGGRPEQLILDPGIGFAKLAHHNWALLRHLDLLASLGHRLVLGTSRKKFLGLVGRPEGQERSPMERDVATAATTFHAAQHRVWGLRVHDVVGTVDALDVAEALCAPASDVDPSGPRHVSARERLS